MASPMAAHSGGSQTDSDLDEVLDLLPLPLPPEPEDLEAEVVRFRLASSAEPAWRREKEEEERGGGGERKEEKGRGLRHKG